ncbi:hypothetical protein A3K55_00810 [Candidatus Shapirobacteria bacterium RBG_13_44_7]|uniref:Amino acid transporter transmembrane domain-containing protein n=1 Tax=Candidatus Shapirobacteria bacterium RBG_13_44_7 TaxID=1802149 RepID=A0A1F7SJ67_9BACT|nr:MAG: hypothetical protein A3K55_00810 [Candidatus Shapirobacteria bacterium RBG_13_44_7]
MSPLINPKLLQATLLQLSGILGAGIFVLPYIFNQSNFSFAIFGLFLVVLLIAQINLFYTDIIAATKGDHQLAGYAQIYYGPKFKILAIINFFLLEIGSLLAYVVLAANFLQAIFPSLSLLTSSLIFFTLIAIFHLSRFKILKRYYQVIPFLALFFVLILFSTALNLPPTPQQFISPNWLFFGPLVFALTGFTIIPEVEEVLRSSSGKNKLVKIASLSGLVLAALIYLIFSFSLNRLSGLTPSPDSVTNLVPTFPLLARLLSVLGLFLVFEGALNQLLVFKETFFRDYHFSEVRAYLLSFLVFIACYLLIKIPLVTIVSLTGSLTLFLSALIICLIRLKISHPPIIILRALLILSVFLLAILA